jgi:hypothetical protein
MEEIEEKPLPTILEKLYQNLPNFLQRATAKATSAEDKDLLLLGSLVTISPCLPNIYGIYAERNVYPNLFLFVTAQASAGKGRLTLCRKLVEPIHRALREQSKVEQQEYQRQLTEYSMAKEKTDMERPQEPPLRMLIIPANNSATLDDYFRHLGNQFFDFYKVLQQQSEPLRFCLTATQQQAFNTYFTQAQNQYLYLCGIDYLATVRRLGLITFRVAMILTALRIMDTGNITSPMVCDDTDFNTALE